MATVHAIFQGKGGTGKSFSATCLAQRLQDKMGGPPICVDVDPVNSTLYAYKTLEVEKLQLVHENRIDPRKFDQLVEILAKADRTVVIDTGASTFIPLTHYFIVHDFPKIVAELGHELVMHVVIAGNELQDETISNFVQQISQFPEPTPFVVWKNEHWGKIVHNGKEFREMKAYLNHKERINSIITLPRFDRDTYGADVADLIRAKSTFAEAIDSPDINIMTRIRLRNVRDTLWKAIDQCPLV